MKYKVVTDCNGKTIATIFNSYELLVNYLSLFNNRPVYGCNSILDNADKGSCELREIKITDCNNIVRTEYVPYSYRYKLLDGNNRNIYSNQLVIDVLSHKHTRVKMHDRWANKFRNNMHFKYRCDPVPNVHKRSHGHYYRNFSYAREMRLVSDPDISKLVRPSRNIKNLPTPWDLEKVRCIEKNWKSQGKYKRQWEHNIPNKHMDTISNYNKRSNSTHYMMEEDSMMDEDIA